MKNMSLDKSKKLKTQPARNIRDRAESPAKIILSTVYVWNAMSSRTAEESAKG